MKSVLSHSARLVALATLLFMVNAALAQSKKPQAKAPSSKDPISYRPIEIIQGDDDLKKLLKQRFNTGIDEFNARFLQFEAGNGGLKTVQETASRVAQAGIELCEKPEEKTAIYTKHLQLMVMLEALVDARFVGGEGNAADVANAKYYRLDAEIQLLKSKRK